MTVCGSRREKNVRVGTNMLKLSTLEGVCIFGLVISTLFRVQMVGRKYSLKKCHNSRKLDKL